MAELRNSSCAYESAGRQWTCQVQIRNLRDSRNNDNDLEFPLLSSRRDDPLGEGQTWV